MEIKRLLKLSMHGATDFSFFLIFHHFCEKPASSTLESL